MRNCYPEVLRFNYQWHYGDRVVRLNYNILVCLLTVMLYLLTVILLYFLLITCNIYIYICDVILQF